MPTPADIARLRSRIAALEGVGATVSAGPVPLGVAEMDRALPWGGLALGCLHEIMGLPHADGIGDGAALAFASVLLGRLAVAGGRPVLWITAGEMPYAPALAALGLPPERVVMVRPRRAVQVLWALEEGLRCRALAGVLAEIRDLDLTAARRLQLAAGASGVPALVLNGGGVANAAVTRWRVAAMPGAGDPVLGVGAWRWRVELLRCRGRGIDDGGRVAAWEVEWDEQARGLRLAAVAGHRAVAPVEGRAAG